MVAILNANDVADRSDYTAKGEHKLVDAWLRFIVTVRFWDQSASRYSITERCRKIDRMHDLPLSLQ